MAEQTNNQWAEAQIGALWKKTGKQTYLRGKLNLESGDVNVIIFPLKNRKSESSPDFLVYNADLLPERQGGNQGGGNNQNTPKPQQSGNRSSGYQPRRQYNRAPAAQQTQTPQASVDNFL